MGTTVFHDTFTDSSGTLLSAHTPDVDTVGGGWYSTGTTDEINASGQAGKNNTAGDNNFVNVGVTDFELTCDFILQTYSYSARKIYLDYVDAATNWRVQLSVTQGGVPHTTTISLIENSTVRETASITWAAGTHAIKITRAGSDINVYVNDALYLSHAAASAPTSTVCGFDIGVRADLGHFDNWTVVSNAVNVTLGTGALTLGGQQVTWSSGIFRTPVTGVISFTGATPAPHAGQRLSPATSALLFNGKTPAPHAGVNPTAGKGALTLAGQTPTYQSALTRTPGTGTLAFTGVSPTFQGGAILAPTVGSLTINGQSPSPHAGQALTVGAGALTFTGYSLLFAISTAAARKLVIRAENRTLTIT